MRTTKTYNLDMEVPGRIAVLAERLKISQGKVIEAAVALLEKETEPARPERMAIDDNP